MDNENQIISFDNHASILTKECLRQLVIYYGKDIFCDANKLENAMKEYGASYNEIYKVLILVQTPGFYQLIGSMDHISQLDINNYIMNACKSSGLIRPVIISFLEAILYSLNAINDFSKVKNLSHIQEDNDTIIPYELYRNDISILKNKIELNEYDDEYYTILSGLYRLGVPEAVYICGKEKYEKAEDTNSKKTAMIELDRASELGCSKAQKFLGQYYYDKGISFWGKANQYYLSLGSGVMDKEDRECYCNIKNYMVFNHKLLFLSILLCAFNIGLSILLPVFSVVKSSNALGLICSLLSVLLVDVAIFSYKKNPARNQSIITLSLFILSMIMIVGRF